MRNRTTKNSKVVQHAIKTEVKETERNRNYKKINLEETLKLQKTKINLIKLKKRGKQASTRQTHTLL